MFFLVSIQKFHDTIFGEISLNQEFKTPTLPRCRQNLGHFDPLLLNRSFIKYFRH